MVHEMKTVPAGKSKQRTQSVGGGESQADRGGSGAVLSPKMPSLPGEARTYDTRPAEASKVTAQASASSRSRGPPKKSLKSSRNGAASNTGEDAREREDDTIEVRRRSDLDAHMATEGDGQAAKGRFERVKRRRTTRTIEGGIGENGKAETNTNTTAQTAAVRKSSSERTPRSAVAVDRAIQKPVRPLSDGLGGETVGRSVSAGLSTSPAQPKLAAQSKPADPANPAGLSTFAGKPKIVGQSAPLDASENTGTDTTMTESASNSAMVKNPLPENVPLTNAVSVAPVSAVAGNDQSTAQRVDSPPDDAQVRGSWSRPRTSLSLQIRNDDSKSGEPARSATLTPQKRRRSAAKPVGFTQQTIVEGRSKNNDPRVRALRSTTANAVASIRPDVAEPNAAEPDAAVSDVAVPDFANLGGAKPGTVEPAAVERDATERVAGKRDGIEAGGPDPSAAGNGTGNRSTVERGTGEGPRLSDGGDMARAGRAPSTPHTGPSESIALDHVMTAVVQATVMILDQRLKPIVERLDSLSDQVAKQSGSTEAGQATAGDTKSSSLAELVERQHAEHIEHIDRMRKEIRKLRTEQRSIMAETVAVKEAELKDFVEQNLEHMVQRLERRCDVGMSESRNHARETVLPRHEPVVPANEAASHRQVSTGGAAAHERIGKETMRSQAHSGERGRNVPIVIHQSDFATPDGPESAPSMLHKSSPVESVPKVARDVPMPETGMVATATPRGPVSMDAAPYQALASSGSRIAGSEPTGMRVRRAVSLVGMQAIVWLLETQHECKTTDHAGWARYTAQVCLESVSHNLLRHRSYNNAIEALRQHHFEMEWFTTGVSAVTLHSARKNYAKWDPPPTDEEWAYEEILLSEIVDRCEAAVRIESNSTQNDLDYASNLARIASEVTLPQNPTTQQQFPVPPQANGAAADYEAIQRRPGSASRGVAR